MKIIIIGGGKVGIKLALQLSREKFDVVLVDQNESKLKKALNEMDVFCVNGNGMDSEVLKQADVHNTDLVIACTSADEINMLSCLLAKRLGARHTIARVRNPVYLKQMDLIREDLHLSMAVSPEHVTANEIARLLLFPEADKVETFMKGRVELVEHMVGEDSQLIHLSLAEVYKKLQIKMLVCAVKREDEVLIPDGSFVIEKGDRLHIAAAHQELKHFFKVQKIDNSKIKKVLICGGGHMGYYLASQLLQAGMQVKIIDENYARCEQLCEELPKATVICGNATNQALLIEEGVKNVDALVALTGMDEENIMLGLFGKSLNIRKIVTKVNDDARIRMVQKLGLDCLVSAKETTAEVIISYVKARMNSFDSDNIETIYYLVDEKIQAQEYIIKKESDYTNKPLRELPIKKNNIIACIGRNRKVIIPGGDDYLEVGDSVIVITTAESNNQLKDILD